MVVPFGKVKFWFIDGRSKSKTYNNENKIIVGKDNFKIISVPPKVWFSFKSLAKLSIVANCLNNPHSDTETLKSNKIKKYRIY